MSGIYSFPGADENTNKIKQFLTLVDNIHIDSICVSLAQIPIIKTLINAIR